MTEQDLVDLLRRDAAHAALVSDFDGTLAPIVDDPAAARPLEGVPEVLEALAGDYLVVAVVSGRPVSFLAAVLPRGIHVAGLYGLEVVDRGERADHPAAGAWREVIDDVATVSAGRGPRGMRTEHKGLSITFHYREHPEAAEEVERWARAQAARSGLVARTARKSVELHPPIPADKGSVIRDLAGSLGDELATVVFAGDDVGDLPAFDALDELAASGITAVRVAVRSSEESAELVARADLTVPGPEAWSDLLRALRL